MSQSAQSKPQRIIGTLVALTVLVVSTATAATVIAAGDPGRRVAAKNDEQFDFASFQRHGEIRARIDSLVAPVSSGALDAPSVARIAAVTRSDGNSVAWQQGDPHVPKDSGDLDLFRRFARAEPLPSLWGYRSDLPDTMTFVELPIRSYQSVRRLLDANEAAADTLLMRGQRALALERARENLAASRHFLDQPIFIDLIIGNYVAKRGAKLLARVAVEADEPHLATSARQLQQLLQKSYQSRGMNSWLKDLDARAPQSLLQIAGDQTLPPALRVESSIVSVIQGTCLHTSELLLGVSNNRRALVPQLRESLADVHRSRELVDMAEYTLDELDAGRLGAAYINAEPRVADLVIPGTIRNRVNWCRVAM